ncbi:MAG: hypothetical protein FLDDKLPJ_00188 [Phycisphaerae bacterium]|nr:hypothetical protein [Phycisphaerae bacterium]
MLRLQDTNNDLAYGGNLELIPPYTNHPLGRIVVGSMPLAQVEFLNSQAVQAPVVQLDTSWLAVGHIDEYMSILPDPAGFGIAFASPGYAKLLLESAATHEPLFYGEFSDNVSHGTVDSADVNGLTDNDSADFRNFVNGFVRIYDGPGKGQVGEIISSGTTEHTLRVGKVWLLENARSVYDAITENEPQFRKNNNQWHPGLIPTTDSKYIVVPTSKQWYGKTPLSGPLLGIPFPAVVSAGELAFDVDLWSKMNSPIETRLTTAWQSVVTALDGHAAPDFLIPTFYLSRTTATGLFEGEAFAYAPGSANMQIWNDQLWIARPFGPRGDVGGQRKDLFAHEVETVLNLPGSRTAHFVDDWDTYHFNVGEVHCGTNVMRIAPNDVYRRWWESEP